MTAQMQQLWAAAGPGLLALGSAVSGLVRGPEKAAAAPPPSQLPKTPPLRLPTEPRRRSSSSVGSGKVAVPRHRAKATAALTAATPTALASAKPATCAATPASAAVATRLVASTPSTAATPAAVAVPGATTAVRAEHAQCVASGDVDAAAAAGLGSCEARIAQRKLVEKAATLGSRSPQKSTIAAAAAADAVERGGETRVGRRRDSSCCSCAVPAPATPPPARRDPPDPQHPATPSAGVFGAPLRVHLNSPFRAHPHSPALRLRAVLKEERTTDGKVQDGKVQAALACAGVQAEAEAVAASRLQAVARGNHTRSHKELWHPKIKAAAEEEAEKCRQRAAELSRTEEARQAEEQQAKAVAEAAAAAAAAAEAAAEAEAERESLAATKRLKEVEGVFELHLLEGTGLMPMDKRSGTSDPYMRLALAGRKPLKSRTIKKTLNPVRSPPRRRAAARLPAAPSAYPPLPLHACDARLSPSSPPRTHCS